jgi:putative DNA primase/helicase
VAKAPPAYPITRGPSKAPISCQINAEHWLTINGYTDAITLDTFRQRLMFGQSEVSDEIVVHLLSEMETSTLVSWRDAHLRNALMNLGYAQASSSLVTWLNGLAWDGTARLDQFFIEVCGATDDAYTQACAKVMFLSAVARAYKPGCQADVMVVMIGNQGIGKSKNLMSLVPEDAWFTDDLGGDLDQRRASEGLQGKWLVEFGEFARINRSTVEMVKAYISRRTDRYRPAYGRFAKDYPRQCVFIGTTNNPHPLQDLENRRFMPLRCPQAFIELKPDGRDQLWAEAVARFKGGEKWWIDEKSIIDKAKDHQEAARHGDVWEEVLSDKLVNQQETSMTEVANLLGIKMDRLDKATQTRIGLVMQALKWHRKRVRNGTTLGYVYERRP